MDTNKVIEVYTASIIEIEKIQAYLEENGITTSIRDEFSEGLHAGFPNGIPNEVSLYVLENDSEKAKSIIADFHKD